MPKVSRYNIDGWVEDLADLTTPRQGHACGHFTNSDNTHVSYSCSQHASKLNIIKVLLACGGAGDLSSCEVNIGASKVD